MGPGPNWDLVGSTVNDWTEVINFNFPKVRKCEEMWSLGIDRPGTPCAVKVSKSYVSLHFDCRTLMDSGTEPALKRF